MRAAGESAQEVVTPTWTCGTAAGTEPPEFRFTTASLLGRNLQASLCRTAPRIEPLVDLGTLARAMRQLLLTYSLDRSIQETEHVTCQSVYELGVRISLGVWLQSLFISLCVYIFPNFYLPFFRAP